MIVGFVWLTWRQVGTSWIVVVLVGTNRWPVIIYKSVFAILCCVASNIIVLWTHLLNVGQRWLPYDILDVTSIRRNINTRQLDAWVAGRRPWNRRLSAPIAVAVIIFKIHSALAENVWHVVKSSVANIDLIVHSV